MSYRIEQDVVRELRVALSNAKITGRNVASWFSVQQSAVQIAATKTGAQVVELPKFGLWVVVEGI